MSQYSMGALHDVLQPFLIFSFFAAPLILIFIVLKILQNEKWKTTQNLLARINYSDFEVLENVQIQTSSYSYVKAIVGFPQKGKLLINKSCLIVLPNQKPSFITFNSTLPLEINFNKQYGQFEIKVCNWKAILLTLKSQSAGIGFMKHELLIEPKENSDFERLKVSLKNWC